MMRLLVKSPRLFLICFGFSCLSFLIMFPTELTLRFIQDLRLRALIEDSKPAVANRYCHLKHHVVFLKVHKAGSSTVMNALQRFGLCRNLTFVLPKVGHYLGKKSTLSWKSIMPLKPNRTYNILCNHVVYNRKAFRSILKQPMFYFAILRSPFEQFLSAFHYYTHVYPNNYLLQVPGANPISEYLKDPAKYEAFLKDPRFSYTNNRMAFDLGLQLSEMRNERNISEYIKILDEDFHFIMIMEYFEISMVLLKRQLCWDLKDILYVPKNMHSTKTYRVGVDDMKLHREWAKADYMIYEHFLEVFWKKVLQEGPDLALEVNHYHSLLTVTRHFCSSKSQSSILIMRTPWNKEFRLTLNDCQVIMENELHLVYRLQAKYRKEYFSHRKR